MDNVQWWEVKRGAWTYYCSITDDEVVVGSHMETGMTDSAGVCSHGAFLQGRFQDVVAMDMGEKVLQEVVAALKARQG